MATIKPLLDRSLAHMMIDAIYDDISELGGMDHKVIFARREVYQNYWENVFGVQGQEAVQEKFAEKFGKRTMWDPILGAFVKSIINYTFGPQYGKYVAEPAETVTNEQQRYITEIQLDKFRATLKIAQKGNEQGLHPMLYKAVIDGLSGMIETLQSELDTYMADNEPQQDNSGKLPRSEEFHGTDRPER